MKSHFFPRHFVLVFAACSLASCTLEESDYHKCGNLPEGASVIGSFGTSYFDASPEKRDSSDSLMDGLCSNEYPGCFPVGGSGEQYACSQCKEAWMLKCPSSETNTYECISVKTDPNNCGSCGNVCNHGSCVGGTCTCDLSEDSCAGQDRVLDKDKCECVEKTDACDKTAESCAELDMVLDESDCTCKCSGGLIIIDDKCVDISNNNSYCGKTLDAVRQCKSSQSCVDGECVCPNGSYLCGEDCVSPSDLKYCGISADCSENNTQPYEDCEAMGNSDGRIYACLKNAEEMYACNVITCLEDENLCGGVCISKDDINNCGSCGNVCEHGDCVGGTCACDLSEDSCAGQNRVLDKDKCECVEKTDVCDKTAELCAELGMVLDKDNCVCKCSGGLEIIDNKCVDISNNNSYCGKTVDAVRQCKSSQSCVDGECVCPNGYYLCGDSCVSPSDPKYCGISADCSNNIKNYEDCDAKGKDDGRIYECKKNDYINVYACTLKRCAVDENLCNGVCISKNDMNNCGGCGVKCDKMANAKAVKCEEGVCKPSECNAGYKISGNNCTKLSVTACGVNSIDCTTYVSHWNDGICNNGVCVVESCKRESSSISIESYHVYGYICEADSNDNCGSHGNKCPSNTWCSWGSCVTVM